jgi:hypothetical protein
MKHHLIGKLIVIIYMDGEPHYNGRQGVVNYVDDIGQLHGTWGGLAVNPSIDKFVVIQEPEREPAHD